MATETVQLTGGAIFGTGIPAGHPDRHKLETLPKTVKLGRKPTHANFRKRAIHLDDFLDIDKYTPPDTLDWYTKAKDSVGRMYLNDRYGCCVIAGKYHAVGSWTANDPDHTPSGVVLGTDSEVYNAYQTICGRGDNGCNIEEVLAYFKNNGLKFNGNTRKIDGYVAIDWTNEDLVKASLALLGANTIGINLPEEWTNSAVWDVTSSRIVGGHDVTPAGYDEKGVYILSWGRVYLITWAAFLSTRWIEEMWALLAPDWYGADGIAPSGLDVAKLKAALADLGKGTIPDVAPPTPPTPPGPPNPPPSPDVHPSFDLKGEILVPGWFGSTHGTFNGTASPKSAHHTTMNVSWMNILRIVMTDIMEGKSVAQMVQDVLTAIFPPAAHEHIRNIVDSVPNIHPSITFMLVWQIAKLIYTDVMAGKTLPDIISDVENLVKQPTEK